MKRIILSLIVCILCSTFVANAQNEIFSKYAEIENIDYVCITKQMLKLLGPSGAKVKGIRMLGMTDNLELVIIVNSTNPEAMEIMKKDYQSLKKDRNYEVVMESRSEKGERVTTMLNTKKIVKEFIMYIDNGKNEQAFILITGEFTDEQLKTFLQVNTSIGSLPISK